jgi:hypothetical protein
MRMGTRTGVLSFGNTPASPFSRIFVPGENAASPPASTSRRPDVPHNLKTDVCGNFFAGDREFGRH